MNGSDKTILRDVIIKVNLGAIKENVRLIREFCGPEVAVMPVIKANGYGHGAVGIAPALMEAGATYLAVATLTEALELRERYRDFPIFILGHTPERLSDIAVANDFVQTAVNLRQARALDEAAARAGKTAKVHLKVDTGFHRLGVYDEDELFAIYNLPHLETEGIFSHLALAGEEEDRKQFALFMDMVERLKKRGCSFRYRHIADSISLVDYPEFHLDMVRPGAVIYGLKSFEKGDLPVRACLTFQSRISQIHELKKGEGVGYDYLWKAPQDARIGTLPFGYSDGYPRNMRDKGYVTIRGVKCPIVGVICMDQCMVDLSAVPEAVEGDVAVIYGDGGNNTMSIAEAAALAGTNKNEIVARLMARPPRIYIEE